MLVNSGDQVSDHKLLPYGLLREPWINIKRGNVVVITKTNLIKPKPFLLRKVKETRLPILRSVVRSSISSFSPDTPENLNGQTVFLVSAIGDSFGFKRTVEKMGCEIVGEKILPDHYQYVQSDWKNVESLSSSTDYIITTEKDWVKIGSFTFSKPIVVVGVDVEVEPEMKLEEILEQFL